MRATSALVLAVVLFAGCASMRSSDMSTLPPNATWGAVPVFPGAKLAALQGNPAQPGPFVYRVWLPADFKIPAHFHPAVENVTVLSGAFHVGMGDKRRRPHQHHLRESGGRPEKKVGRSAALQPARRRSDGRGYGNLGRPFARSRGAH